jgi:F420-dependent oxidoreductase-like protein
VTLRIGITGGGSTVDRIIDQAAEAENDGFTSLWYGGGGRGMDVLTLLPLVGRATSRIELGTAIVQTYPRHPILMAQQAATVAQAIGDGRFTLGVGVSHRPVIENSYGLSYDSNARHLHEYLAVLDALLQEGTVRFAGEEYRAAGDLGIPVEPPVPVLVAALAARALRSAGELASGTITWMANPHAIENLIAPTLREAAAGAGRPDPRIVAGMPVAVTDDVDGARETAARTFSVYGTLPNYQRVLAAGGISSPAEAAIVGPEDKVATALEDLVAAGASDIWAAPFPVGDDRSESRRRTRALLRELGGA